MEYTIQNGFMALAADTHGAQLCDLHSLRHPERHLLWTGQTDIWPWHAPVCFPWCGKLKGGLFQDRGVQYPAPQHGFVREQEHRLVCQGEDFLEFCLDWRGEETQWPFFPQRRRSERHLFGHQFGQPAHARPVGLSSRTVLPVFRWIGTGGLPDPL